MKQIKPHKGPQEKFLACSADIAIYGGSAGGGKTYGLLLEAVRSISVPGFDAVMFRRTSPELTNAGGLWSESFELYSYLRGVPKGGSLDWHFPAGSRISFRHLQHEKDKHSWQGAQVALVCFDELTHFTMSQFFYLLSRNRSTCGVKPYIRATCNPDPDVWVRHFIEWWIDPKTGLPIPERDGVIRYMVRDGDTILWGDSPEELPSHLRDYAKSVTFIAARLTDNPTLMRKDPQYMGNLMALPTHERERLLGGNWNIRLSPGMYFKREMFAYVDTAPVGRSVRFWDRAATEASESNPDPDWTVGLKLRKCQNGYYYIEDVVRGRWRSFDVEAVIKNTASADGPEVKQILEEEPGASGKTEAAYLIRALAGYPVEAISPQGRKEVRAGPVAAQAGAGNLRIIRGSWNRDLITELEAFPNSGFHDDQVDALSGAFNYLCLADRSPRIRVVGSRS